MRRGDAPELLDRAQHASVGEEKVSGRAKLSQSEDGTRWEDAFCRGGKAHRDRVCHDTHKFREVESGFPCGRRDQGWGRNEAFGSGPR